jgi:hypothetical protein
MPVGDAAIAHLASGGQLQRLSLNEIAIGDAALAVIGTNTNLGYGLHLKGMPISDKGLAHLKGLSKVVVLDLSETQVTDEGLPHLAGMSWLRDLRLKKTQVTGSGLQALQALRLKDLDLSESAANDAGLAGLKGFTSLVRISLANTSVGDQGVKHLPVLDIGRILDLSGTKVTDQCAAALVGTRVSDLKLDDTALTDQGLSELIMGGVSTVSVKRTKVTSQGIRNLNNRLNTQFFTIDHDLPWDDVAPDHLREPVTADAPVPFSP